MKKPLLLRTKVSFTKNPSSFLIIFAMETYLVSKRKLKTFADRQLSVNMHGAILYVYGTINNWEKHKARCNNFHIYYTTSHLIFNKNIIPQCSTKESTYLFLQNIASFSAAPTIHQILNKSLNSPHDVARNLITFTCNTSWRWFNFVTNN